MFVSIHAPARGATPLGESATIYGRFQSTRPRGARPRILAYPHMRRGFNPRARAGRDEEQIVAKIGEIVSIHAPARGATLTSGSQSPAYTCFNPRARAGRDGVTININNNEDNVSIHAPARGATTGTGTIKPVLGGFNPRARAGRDLFPGAEISRRSSFNPRARAGRDRCP